MSTLDSSTKKRKLAEDGSSEDASESVTPVRSGDIWYEDGNIVLQAEHTQYKVYRGILAKSSPVFEDMFSFPQPPASEVEMVDGCFVVHLSDSAEEVRYILQALFERRCVVEFFGMRLLILTACMI